MTALSVRKMPSPYYEGAPREVQEQIAYIITLPRNHGAGMTHEILLSERMDDGSALGIDMGSLSVGQHFALNPYELSQYKRANGHRKTKWMDLPEDIRHTILRYVNS